jgi:ABC-type transport system involved in multi-copper enzyme maturation permease subunit
MKKGMIRNLFVGNAMVGEATRAWRRYWNGGGSSAGRIANYVTVFLVVLGYLWLLALITKEPRGWLYALPTLELLCVTILIPITVYGAIAGERERATWEALILTRLTPGQIIFGKVYWRVLLVLGIVVLSALLIFMSVALPYDGVSAVQRDARPPLMKLLQLQFMVLAWGIFLCSLGLWVSANSRRSVTSAAVLFGLLIGVLGFLPLLFSLMGISMSAMNEPKNPIFALIQFFWLHYNPFHIAYAGLETRDSDVLMQDWIFSLPGAGIFYLIGAGWCLYAVHVRLRILEEPKRR